MNSLRSEEQSTLGKVMGVVGLLAETVEEEELGIILNATKVAANISSSAIDMANSSKEYEEDLYRAFSFWIEGIAVTLISIFGIVGNIACISVFSSKSVDLKPSFANILKCLSIDDICLLVKRVKFKKKYDTKNMLQIIHKYKCRPQTKP